MATNNVKVVLTAQDKTAAAFKTATANIGALKNSAASLAGSLGGLGAGISLVGILSLTKSVIDSIDSLNDLKDATGASIENISALEDVAARTGTSMDTVGAALIKLNQTLNSAKADSAQAKAITAIGLSVEDLKRLDPAEALLKVAVAMGSFADDGNKARLAQELFGKSLREVAPLLNDLAEKGKLVGTVTAEQALEAEKFNKQLFALQKNSQDWARDLAGPVVSSLNLLIQKLQDGAKAGNGFWAVMGQSFMQDVRDWTDMPNSGPEYAQRLGEISEKLKDTNLHETRRLSLLREQSSLQAKLAALPDFSPDNESAAETARLARRPAIVSSSGGSSASKKDPYAEAARYIEGLQKQIEKTQELTTLQQLGMDINAGRLGKMTTAQQAEAIALAQKIDSIKVELDLQKQLADLAKETSAEQEEFFQNVTAADDAKQARIQALLGATTTGKNNATQADLALLQTELENGRISTELYSEAVIELFDLAGKETKTTISLAEELGLTFTSAFEDAIVGGGDLRDVLAGLEQDIMRIVTRKLVTEPLGNALTGMLGNALGGGFDNFDPFSLISFDGGGSTGGNARSGGLDGKGGFVAMLHPQETVIDHTKGQQAGNTVNVTVNQTFAAGTSRATTMQAAADARRQLEYAGRNL